MGRQGAGNRMWAQFRGDLGQAAGVLVSDPLLPALTAVLTGGAVALIRFGHAWAALALPLELFLLGFAGTQRVWFLRGLRFRRLDPDEVWPMTMAFLPRFWLFGLVTGLCLVGSLLVLRAIGGLVLLPSHAAPVWILLVPCLIGDVVLTFVTPALALSVRSWRKALRQGVRMLGATWPSSAFYVLTPGIALFALAAWAPAPGGIAARALLAAAGALLALWFRGAVVAFYVRLHPTVSDSGAAYADEPAPSPRRRA